MSENSPLKAELISKPMQLMAAYLVTLIVIVGAFLLAATNISEPIWIRILLSVSAVAFVPLFVVMTLQIITKHRHNIMEDENYINLLEKRPDIIASPKKPKGELDELPKAEEPQGLGSNKEIKDYLEGVGYKYHQTKNLGYLFGIEQQGLKVLLFARVDDDNDLILESYGIEIKTMSLALSNKLLEMNDSNKRGQIGIEYKADESGIRITANYSCTLYAGKKGEFDIHNGIAALVLEQKEIESYLKSADIEFVNFTLADVVQANSNDNQNQA